VAWFADLLLLVALFASANLALAWGELGSFRLPGDKSALAGLAGVLVFMVIRWSALAAALAVGVARGGWPGGVDSGTRSQVFVTLLAHLVLGIVSYQGFEWVVRGIQADDGGPQRAAWLFAIVLPLPAFMVALGGIHRGFIRRHPALPIVVLAGLLAAHLAGWRAGSRS
jgi:hypothetical protein